MVAGKVGEPVWALPVGESGNNLLVHDLEEIVKRRSGLRRGGGKGTPDVARFGPRGDRKGLRAIEVLRDPPKGLAAESLEGFRIKMGVGSVRFVVHTPACYAGRCRS